MNMKNIVQDKIQEIVNKLCKEVENKGRARLETCDHPNWDRDVWDYHQDIYRNLLTKGYNVSLSVEHKVTDIVVLPKITLRYG
mgnify:CR=1 FL=1|jgi:hypothetical protein